MTEALLTILYILVFIFLIFRLKFFRIEGVSRLTLSITFVIKVIFGISLTMVFLYYYDSRSTSDIFKYFDDSEFIFSAFFDNPLDYLRMVTGIDSEAPHLSKYYDPSNYWFKPFNYNLYNDNRTIIRFNAIVRIFSFGAISVHTVFASFLSFCGLTAIFKTLRTLVKDKFKLVFIAVFFIPSVLFWTSGVLKESVLMFPAGMLVYAGFNIAYEKIRIKHILLLLVMAFFLIILKFYILVAMLPGLISMIWIGRTDNKKALLKFFIAHILVVIAAVNSTFIFGYNFTDILSWKQRDFVRMVTELNNVGSQISIPELHPNLLSIAKNTPQAIANTLFRPHLFEAYSPVVLLAALETTLISILLFISITFFRKECLKTDKSGLVLFCTSFFLIMFILSGLTTPVLGSLVRYKSPALPFLFTLFIFVINFKKLRLVLSKIPILNNFIKTNEIEG